MHIEIVFKYLIKYIFNTKGDHIYKNSNYPNGNK